MESVIRKWGNSPALRLPSSVLKEAGYRLGQKVELVVRRGRIVIRPLRKLEYDLNELLDGITPRNLHGRSDFGAPAGKDLL